MNRFFHGDDVYNYSDIKYNFSSNIWPYFNYKNLYDFIASNLNKIKNYPDPNSYNLLEYLSKYHNLNKSNLLIGNGSVELFSIIAYYYYGSKSAILAPTFVEYEKVSVNAKHSINYIFSFDELEKCDFDLVWICNPNNPNGKIFDTKMIIDLISKYENKLFIVDEAYIDYTTNIKSLIEYVNIFKNLIITRSFTKKFAIPGLRIGYLAANDILVSKLKDYLPTWNVNVLAQITAIFLLENNFYYQLPLDKIYALKDNLCNKLNEIDYLAVIESDMHYFLIKNNKYKSYELKEKLAKNYGILVRDASNFYGLNDSYIRIATLDENANEYLVDCLKQL